MQEHLAVLQDMKNHLDKQKPISTSLEILKAELEQLEVSKLFFMFVLQLEIALRFKKIYLKCN